jgi:hypothetical protein
MRFEIPIFAGLLSASTALLTRMQVQGFEAGLISAVAEYGLRGLCAVAKLLCAAR